MVQGTAEEAAEDMELLRFGAHLALALRDLANSAWNCTKPVADARLQVNHLCQCGFLLLEAQWGLTLSMSILCQVTVCLIDFFIPFMLSLFFRTMLRWIAKVDRLTSSVVFQGAWMAAFHFLIGPLHTQYACTMAPSDLSLQVTHASGAPPTQHVWSIVSPPGMLS